jgi:hypothetical protein
MMPLPKITLSKPYFVLFATCTGAVAGFIDVLILHYVADPTVSGAAAILATTVANAFVAFFTELEKAAPSPP